MRHSKKISSKGSTSATKLTAGMHGPSFGSQDRRTTSVLLPRFRFPASPGSMLRSPSAMLSLTRADIPKRPFARPQRELASEPPFRGQCSWPTSFLSTGPSPNPLQSDVPKCPADLRSPSGVFMPFRIVAFSQFSLPEAHLRKPPDSLSLPVARLHK